jgi:hypothetical protein
MIREPFQRFYSTLATNYAESIPARKAAERARLDAEVEAFLARGGAIKEVPYGVSADYIPPFIDIHLQGTPAHNPELISNRARRRKYGGAK